MRARAGDHGRLVPGRPNADSLDLVELIYAFEENTGLEIPDEDAEKITTVGQAWEYIQEKAGS